MQLLFPLEYRTVPTVKSKKGVYGSHRSKVTRLILRTAKEFWLPRRELIEDEYILSLNNSFAKLPPSMQAKERQQLHITTRISNFKRQLGGFYLLWALYWNQPGFSKKRLKRIEITAHDYGNMKAFEKELKTVPIPFLRKEDRMKLIEQVQFMMNQLVQNRAYDVCLFAEDVSEYSVGKGRDQNFRMTNRILIYSSSMTIVTLPTYTVNTTERPKYWNGKRV